MTVAQALGVMTAPTFLVAGLALVYATLFVEGSRRLALKRAWFDRPHDDRAGGPAWRAIPRVGGLGILAAVAACLLPMALRGAGAPGAPGALDNGLILAGVLPAIAIGLVGVVDDIRSVAPALKAVALVAAGVVSAGLGLRIDAIPGVEVALPAPLAALVTVAWFVAVPTAFNFIDGLDGLAAGLAVIACVALAVLGGVLGDTTVALVAALLAAATAGFWWHNRHPAKIFMGDGGAMFIGYLVAALSVRLLGVADSAPAGAAVLLAMAVPLTDFALAMLRRFRRGAPFSSDADHLHHRLSRRHGHAEAVRKLHAVAFLVAAAALALVLPAMLGPLLAAGAGLWLLDSVRRGTLSLQAPRMSLAAAAVLLISWTGPHGGGVSGASTPVAEGAPVALAQVAGGAGAPSGPPAGWAAAEPPSRSPFAETALP